MPVFIAVQTVEATPAVTVTTSNPPSYEQIKSSLGPNVYKVDELYFSCPDVNQINSIINFDRYDSSGLKSVDNITPIIDPMQPRTTLFYSVAEKNVLINGQNSFVFELRPQAILTFKLFSKHTEVGNFVLPDGKPALPVNNFIEVETATGMFDFFGKFKNRL